MWDSTPDGPTFKSWLRHSLGMMQIKALPFLIFGFLRCHENMDISWDCQEDARYCCSLD